MRVSDIQNILDCQVIGNDVLFCGAQIDSRQIVESNLFVALKGEHVDGHEYLQNAKANGASCALVEKAQENCELTQIVVSDVTKSLGIIARFYRQSLETKIIGVTGSNGKTSMKESIYSLLFHVCRQDEFEDDLVYKTQGNLNNHLGLPISVLNIPETAHYAVLEMGMNNAGEIDYLTNIAQPNIAIITNAMEAHLEGMKSLDNIVAAKGEIFNGLDQAGIAVLNANSFGYQAWLDMLADKNVLSYQLVPNGEPSNISGNISGNVVTGWVEKSFIDAQDIAVKIENNVYYATLPLIGQHNVENTLGACAVLHALNIDAQKIVDGIENIKLINGRSKLAKGVNDCYIIDDSYNANPGSMKAACKMLMTMPVNTKVLVMGDMAELGENEDKLHEQVGAFAKELGIDMLFATGALSLNTCTGFGEKSFHFNNKQNLVKSVRKIANKDVILLIKGSNSSKMYEVAEELTNNEINITIKG